CPIQQQSLALDNGLHVWPVAIRYGSRRRKRTFRTTIDRYEHGLEVRPAWKFHEKPSSIKNKSMKKFSFF
ncbi:MAG: hypothetical protein QM690_16405, partial [Sphingobium sp.]